MNYQQYIGIGIGLVAIIGAGVLVGTGVLGSSYADNAIAFVLGALGGGGGVKLASKPASP